MTRRGAQSEFDGAAVQRRGPTTAAVVVLASEAREAAWAGDPDTAFALLTQAAGASLTEDDREAVYGAIGALVAEADTALSIPSVVTTLAATPAGADRVWARRALAVAYAVTGRASEADAVADSLTTAGADHATFGHSVRVRLAVEADSLSLALDRLGAFAATVVEADTLATETYASALALVVASFPGVDPATLPGGTAGRGTAGRDAGNAALEDATAASSASRAVYENGLSVYPNPTASRGTVRISSAEAANAVVSVYDALGRRVAVLHDGALAAGPHDLVWNAGAFAPGIYVVHLRIRSEGSPTWTDVRRVTVAR